MFTLNNLDAGRVQELGPGRRFEAAKTTLKRGSQALGGPAFVFLPRIAPALLTLTCVYSCIRFPPKRSELRRLFFWTFLITVYPLLSMFWALDARRALTVIGVGAAIAAASILIFERTERLKEIFWPAIAYGIPTIVFANLIDISLGIPLRTSLAEIGISWVGQPATIGKSGQITPSAMNWSMTIMALSLFPYLNATREAAKSKTWKRVLRMSVAAAIISAAFLSTHETSKIAVCTGAAVYLVAHASKTLALGIVMAGWLTSVAATPLIMSAVLPMTKDLTSFVPASLQHRFVIWHVALNDIAAHPWKGVGVGSTRVNFREKEMNRAPDKITGLAAHSHNWFLDLWRELGAIGAALAVLWVALIAQKLFLQLRTVPPELIAFAGLVLAMSTSSFSLWAPWYLCAIGLSFAMFGISKGVSYENRSA